MIATQQFGSECFFIDMQCRCHEFHSIVDVFLGRVRRTNEYGNDGFQRDVYGDVVSKFFDVLYCFVCLLF